ncbi:MULTISPECIES: sialic acid TRAP transporter substrate-binding protein SiaP [Halocynthiibacter]|uniref:Sialic acid TRAP transporter substrate-binding protein SiaP n=1 Tax=Halocynthiibacter halioticoli TaxID=2986804 RepID=A0AAE3IXA8_9RHOB|nr:MULTISPECIES: sialic acid TRAP transporter substrate-binding protein SiaP [Halocynthiibacter]MCV6823429.1 sialic acid TRAP transporter substrate-binding protein SiaP [Halocynthiibacter halioticoli]MCW4056430.1 sialic acid TRAP transporter substrate-binding protein SiaP [Halocynthiibacter sp. SDUM655004]
MKFTNFKAAFAAGVFALASGTAAFAAETLKWAHVYEEGSSYHQVALWAADEIKSRTDGRVEIQVFPASSLGKEVEINEGLGLGSVDIIYTGPSFVERYYGPIAISDYPFIMRGYDHWLSYRGSDLFAELSEGYHDATGNQVLGLVYYGQRHVTSNKPILTPADMEGLKIRVPNSPLMLMFPNAVGANPTPMAFSEVYLALQQGVVDAQENPLPTIKFKKFYEVQSNINLTGHILNSLLTIASDDALARVGDDEAVLREVLDAAALKASEEIRQSEEDLVSWFEEQGIAVNVVDKKPFQDAVLPMLTGDGVPYTMDHFKRLGEL